MDIEALIAALPAATIAAVAGDPQGLTNAATQVYVSDVRRAREQDVEAWWQFDPTPVVVQDGNLGGWLVRYGGELRVSKKSGTRAELRDWSRQFYRAFNGARNPAIADLVGARVTALVLDEAPAEGPDVEMAMAVEWVGVETP